MVHICCCAVPVVRDRGCRNLRVRLTVPAVGRLVQAVQ